MKITKVEIYQLHSPQPNILRPVVCRVYTDNGLYGDGEAAVAYGRGTGGAFGQLREYAELIIGKDPLNTEAIWNSLQKNTFWGVNGGPIIYAAISALDMALWDIKAKYFNVPLYVLLGGKVNDNLRAYASQLQFGWSDHYEMARKPEEYAANALKAVEQGFDCIKIDFFTFDEDDGHKYDRVTETTGLIPAKTIDMVERRVKAVRDAIGYDVDIIVENHSATDAQSSVQIGRMMEQYRIFAFEEPNTPTPISARYIASKVNIPMANGERLFTRWQYIPYLNDQTIQLIQPDIGNCGGITEVKKLCDLAHAYDVGVQAHVCASPLSTAFALHLEASIPNFTIHEHHRYTLLPWNIAYCKYDLQPVNGKFKVPEIPGCGNEFTAEALAAADRKDIVE